MPSNTKENGFETLIVDTLVNSNGYEQGITTEYNKQYAIDEDRLFRFLMSTQKKAMDELHILDSDLEKDRFFKQLDKKLKSDGVIELLRKGLRYKHLRLDLFYVRPSVHNPEAAALYEKNIFSVTRQLQYSSFNPRLALDVCAFINGLPVITMELKNQLTKQNVFDAVEQYKNDRTPDEVLFSFKRCIVHFAVDDNEIRMCTELKGKKSWFLPFNKGFNNGAGNPPNPNGIKTDYLWKEILTKDELSNIIENYAQVIAEKDEDTGVTKYKQVFPRYHQLSVVKSLLSDAKRDGVGGRYLIQHSAGSGKSNSIAWLAHQLVTLKNDSGKEIFDTVIVVTDRINLDKQIKDTIKQFMQVSATVGWAKSAGELKQLLNEGKKIIIILDFVNEPGVIKEAFDRYYKTTILSGETDVNKLNDLIDTMESIQVYSDADVDTFVERYLADEPRDRLDPILDHCVEVYEGLIIEDQIEFKSCAKTFVRTYNFLSAILPYGSVQWEKLSIFLNLLIPKLPKPEGEDYTEGLLEDVDLESYRAEAQQTMRIQLENENGEIDPIPVSTSVGVDVPELDTLTNILKEFHDIFGNIEWTDEDKIKKQINDIIESVRRDEKYNNAMQFSDKQNARDESDRAAHEAVMNSMQSGLELFREVQNNPSFRKWLFDSAFNSTYQANHNQTSL